MSAKSILVIPGDGIGPEVTAAAQAVLAAAARPAGITVEYTVGEAGGAALDRHGVPLPPATLSARSSPAIMSSWTRW
mgnify:CR=1 FL=1